MSLAERLSLSLEAISFQNGLLHKELTLAIKKVREADPKDYEKVLEKQNIPGIVERHTGLGITVEYAKARQINAWVRPPLLDKNHPLLNDLRQNDIFDLEGLAMVNANKGVIEGEVDLANSTVSGVFSNIVSTVSLTRGLLTSDKMTDGEVSAIIIHELGHLFTYFEHLGKVFTTNFVLQTITHELFEQNDIKRKYRVIKEGSKVLDIDIDDPEALVEAKNKEIVQTVVLRKELLKNQSEAGSRTYDATAWEMMADQFSNRHGAGRDLVSALGKMMKSSWNPDSLSIGTYLLMEVVKFVMFMALLIGGPTGVLFWMVLLFSDSNYDDYDKTHARIRRIKQDLVAALKEPGLSRTEKERLDKDLEAIDTSLRLYTDRRGLLQWFHSTLVPKRRKQYKQTVFQQEMETLAANDLFVKANKFDLIK